MTRTTVHRRAVPARVRDLLGGAAARFPSATALRDADGELTYAELRELAERTTGWLLAEGVAAGDRVLVHAVSRRSTVALLLGGLRAGAVVVPYSPDMTVYQLAGVVADAAPALLVTDDPRHLGLAPAAARPTGQFRAAVADLPRTGPAATGPGDDDVALLLYTSGSTARPKAVVCTHAQVSFAVHAVAERLGYRHDDVVFCRLPLSFDYGLYQVFLTVLAGGTLVLADPAGDTRLLAQLSSHRATVVPIVPSLGAMLLDLASRNPDAAPRTVRLFTNTGEHLTGATASGLRAVFPGSGVQMMFGTTECKRITVMERDGDLLRPGSVGRALPGTTVRVVDAEGRAVPAGEVGEITVQGPHLMAGYWRAPELTAERYRTGPAGTRTLFTGDFGRLDEAGYLYFEGRRDHIYKQRGIRTSTVEVEAAALALPGVRQAAVVPPTAAAEAVLHVVGDVEPNEVVVGMRRLLGAAKAPVSCRVLSALPLTANGKVDRATLEARPEDGDGE